MQAFGLLWVTLALLLSGCATKLHNADQYVLGEKFSSSSIPAPSNNSALLVIYQSGLHVDGNLGLGLSEVVLNAREVGLLGERAFIYKLVIPGNHELTTRLTNIPGWFDSVEGGREHTIRFTARPGETYYFKHLIEGNSPRYTGYVYPDGRMPQVQSAQRVEFKMIPADTATKEIADFLEIKGTYERKLFSKEVISSPWQTINRPY